MLSIVALLGLGCGSFINALVWRLHEQAGSKKKSRPELSILQGRSMCPRCHHTLGLLDLLPIISWLSLGGKCRYCHKPISWQYPLVELLTVGLFVISFLHWPYDLQGSGIVAFGLWLASLVILIALAVYDLRWMLLPDKLTFILTGVTILLTTFLAAERGVTYVLSATAGAVFLSGIFWLLFQLSAGKWIGGGDVKIALALGMLAGGMLESLILLFLASLAGSIVGVAIIIKEHSRNHKIAFGPFLICSAMVVFLFGTDIINAYRSLFGF